MIEPKGFLYTSHLGFFAAYSDRPMPPERQKGLNETALYPQSAIDALQAENERLRAALESCQNLIKSLRVSPYGGLTCDDTALEASHD